MFLSDKLSELSRAVMFVMFSAKVRNCAMAMLSCEFSSVIRLRFCDVFSNSFIVAVARHAFARKKFAVIGAAGAFIALRNVDGRFAKQSERYETRLGILVNER